MRDRILFLLSLILNAGLAAVLILRPSAPPPPSAVPAASVEAPAAPPPAAPVAVTTAATPNPVAPVTNASPAGLVKVWPFVEADSYRAYIENLRAIGCPEETIRDIILVDVLKQYTQRLREVRAQQGEKPYWKKTGASTRAEDVARRVLEMQLVEERRALFQSLVGRDIDGELASLLGDDRDDDGSRSDWLSPDRKRALDSVMRAFDARRLELIATANGYPDEAVRKELRALDEERRKAFEDFLSPGEKRLRDLRESGSARRLIDGPLAVVDVTEKEYETIFDLARNMHEQRHVAYETAKQKGDEKAGREAAETVYAAYDEQLRQLLGDERHQEYVRGRDPEYRNLLDFTRSMQLPAGTATKLLESRRSFGESERIIRENKQLSKEDRNARLADLRSQRDEQLRQLLGDRALDSYRHLDEDPR